MRAACEPGSLCLALLTAIVAAVWRAQVVPAFFCESVLVAIFKGKGSRSERTNYRGITLVLFVWRVIMALLLHDVCIPIIEASQPEAQCGSRPGRGCPDQLFTLRVLQDRARARRLPLFAAFVDLAKAFDSVDRTMLFLVMRSYGLPVGVMRLFESMYSQTSCAVRAGRVLGRRFPTSSGVQQGCLSGSWCFILFMHRCLCPILSRLEELGVQVEYRLKDGRHVRAASILHLGLLLIVDDTTLLASDITSFRTGLALLHTQFRRFGLCVNVTKSFAICFGGIDSLCCISCGRQDGARADTMLCELCGCAMHVRCAGLAAVPAGSWVCDGCGGAAASAGSPTCAREPAYQPPLELDGAALQWAEQGKYLGVLLSADCSLDLELTARIRAARANFAKMRPLLPKGFPLHKGMRPCFARCFSALVTSVLLYGSEAWALSQAQLGRLASAYHAMLRSALPPSELHRFRRQHPDEPYKKYPSENLRRFFGVPTVDTLLARRQLRWLGHVMRMGDERVPRMLYSSLPAKGGRGVAGRPLPTLVGREGVYAKLIQAHFTRDVRRKFFSGSRDDWRTLAHEREQWRNFVASVVV